MKKGISILLILSMLAALTACGTKAPAKQQPTETTENESDETMGADDNTSPVDDLELDTMLSLFEDMTEGNLSNMVHRPITPEEAGYEMGYAEFAGEFESAMALAPMMNISPFVLIVYRLGEGADATAFAEDIEKHADPGKWVCVQADKVFTRVSGRTVLFVMCSTDLVGPISDSFEAMTKEDFDPSEHLVDLLADKSAQDVYEELYELFSVEQYGFLNPENSMTLGPDTGHRMADLELSKVEESIWEEGFVAKDEMDEDRAYLFGILQLKEGESAEDFAENVGKVLDPSALAGGEATSVVAYGGNFVIVYAGTGSYAISATALETHLPMTYRMRLVTN